MGNGCISSFFEKRVGDYQKAGVMSRTKNTTQNDHEFTTNADF